MKPRTRSAYLTVTTALLGLLLLTGRAGAADDVPLIAALALDQSNGVRWMDSVSKLSGRADAPPAALLSDLPGQAAGLQFGPGGAKASQMPKLPLLDKLGHAFTISFWIKADAYPANGAGILAKRQQNTSAPFVLSLGKNGELGFEGFNGADWTNLFSQPNALPKGQWSFVALTFEAGKNVEWHVNGKRVASKKVARASANNDQALQIGSDPFRGDFAGAIGPIVIYAVALTPEQLQSARDNKLATRPAKADDFPVPQHRVTMSLVRHDLPRPFTNGFAPTRFDAQRVAGPNAVDWCRIELNGKPLFEKESTEHVDLPLRDGNAARPFFQQPGDETLQPGNHWLRPLQWLWGRRYVYQTDPTARSGENRYELWLFPVKIAGPIESVRLECDGKVVYDRKESLQSITLLLPQNQASKPYALSVNGQPAVALNVGLQPIVPGNPKQLLLPIDLTIAGVTVKNLDRPAEFPYAEEWKKDLAALTDEAAPGDSGQAPSPWLSAGVKRSPIEVFTIALPHGMSGGHFMRSEHKSRGPNASDSPKARFEGGVNDYAEFLLEQGYDKVYEMSGNNSFNSDGERSYDALAAALADQGIRFGISPGVDWKRPFLAHPNLAFFSLNLPDYRAPLYRDVQLITQRLARHGNFAGISIGADNAAYESFWAWAPPEPGRPWAEAFRTFAADGKAETPAELSWPEPKSLGGKSSVKEFQDYIARYNRAFEQYGYWDNALREIDPHFSATTGSYGSSPGVGARGGYPWATIPAKNLFSGLSLMQVYDWNEVEASKPLHNVALIDRAKSYYPDKRLQTAIDEFGLFFGKQARQRAYALAMTRGVDAVGTSFFASTYNARGAMLRDQRELHAEVKSLGGAYAGTRPDATIGVLYVNEQALLRKPNQDANPPDKVLLDGSHEGKTTEALILCHAAGWPARIITPDELQRGLPSGMRAILLVGLNREDASWVWHDGLEPALKAFTAAGGRILRDSQSVCPIDSIATDLQVRAYIAQGAGTAGGQDRMPMILERNRDNIARLQAAMKDVPKPVAFSDSSTVWAVPHTTGDVQYVTIVNWGYEPGKNASYVVKPTTATIEWSRKGSVYHVLRGKLTDEQAKTVDLTTNGYAIYAMPAREPGEVKITHRRDNGRHLVQVDVSGLRGVPVKLDVRQGSQSHTVFAASATDVVLPIEAGFAGEVSVVATELLSNKSGQTAFTVEAAKPQAADSGAQVARFLDRRGPLTIALTPEQAADPAMKLAADRLVAWFTQHGRTASIGYVEPNGVVLSLQPLQGSQTYPRWRTIEADLVLLGRPGNNPLLLDQARGRLLDSSAGVRVTYSPFVGEFNALNVIAADVEAVSKAVDQLIAANPKR